jgi:hypothetical protein
LEPIKIPGQKNKKVTFLHINSRNNVAQNRKNKLTRPPNWNGLDAITPKYGIRGFGFTGHKSGFIDIKHFINKEKRKLSKSQ